MFEYEASNIRVIDGDTVECSLDLGFHVSIREKLRLYGINAPEMRGDTSEAGKRAADHLLTMIAEDSPIRIKTQKDKQGKYGRYIATLFGASGANINQRMVYHGYAVSVEYR